MTSINNQQINIIRTMIYDLDVEDFLAQDIEFIIDKINEFYDFEKVESKLVFQSKLELASDLHFASIESHNSFLNLVPKI